MARTNNLTDFLTDVADAIRTKKGSQETIQASDFDTEIENLPSGGGADLSDYFLSVNDLSATSSNNMLNRIVKKIPAFEYTNTNFQYAFKNCSAEEIDCSGFTFDSYNNLRNMFENCTNLKKLDLSVINTTNVTNMQQMFDYCKKLTKIDMRSFDFSNVTTFTNMFGANASSGVPNNCEIIVADNTAKTWITSNFSRLTNVKTVAEYEAE